MKKIALLLISVFFSLTLCAQEHLKFKGIPIDGPIDAYVEQLTKKGFTPLDVDIQPNLRMMEGMFTGAKTTLVIRGTGNENTACKVAVLFESTDSWETLTDRYFSLKSSYTQKYGTPITEVEEMESPYDEFYPFLGLEKEKGTYETGYSTPNGYIVIKLQPDNSQSAYIAIHYEDRINLYEKCEQNIQDEI